MKQKMYKAVIVGAGNIGAFFDMPESKKILSHAHAVMVHPRVELLGFYDVDEDRSQKAVSIWNCKSFDSLESALYGADVAYCCVPDKCHFDMLKQISEYPLKMVVAEKPIAATVGEALKIKQIYERKKIPIILNYSRRFLPEFKDLRQNIKTYGKLIEGVGYYGKGIVHNGSHMIDLLSYFFERELKIESTGHAVYDYFDSDPSCNAIIGIGNGQVHMLSIDCRIATIFELDLFFEKKRVRIIDSGNKIELYSVRESEVYNGYSNYVWEQRIEVDYSNAMLGLINNYCAYMAGKEKILCSVDDGINVLSKCMEIKEKSDG